MKAKEKNNKEEKKSLKISRTSKMRMMNMRTKSPLMLENAPSPQNQSATSST